MKPIPQRAGSEFDRQRGYFADFDTHVVAATNASYDCAIATSLTGSALAKAALVAREDLREYCHWQAIRFAYDALAEAGISREVQNEVLGRLLEWDQSWKLRRTLTGVA